MRRTDSNDVASQGLGLGLGQLLDEEDHTVWRVVSGIDEAEPRFRYAGSSSISDEAENDDTSTHYEKNRSRRAEAHRMKAAAARGTYAHSARIRQSGGRFPAVVRGTELQDIPWAQFWSRELAGAASSTLAVVHSDHLQLCGSD